VSTCPVDTSKEWFALYDDVAHFLEPFRDRAVGDCLTQLRHSDIGHEFCLSSSVATRLQSQLS